MGARISREEHLSWFPSRLKGEWLLTEVPPWRQGLLSSLRSTGESLLMSTNLGCFSGTHFIKNIKDYPKYLRT
jgi:hypothetical protein